MAQKDPSLDQAIVDAARAEFLAHGFQNASLHKIAQRAGTTTGALYTRYESKDALFCSLVSPTLELIRDRLAPVEQRYMDAQALRSREALMEAIRYEEQFYLDLLFSNYEDCVLFFCRNEGSSLEQAIRDLTEKKTRQTIEYFRAMARKPLDLDGLQLIVSNQFHCYRQILLDGCSKEKAKSCLETLDIFLEAGWKAIFDSIL